MKLNSPKLRFFAVTLQDLISKVAMGMMVIKMEAIRLMNNNAPFPMSLNPSLGSEDGEFDAVEDVALLFMNIDAAGEEEEIPRSSASNDSISLIS